LKPLNPYPPGRFGWNLRGGFGDTFWAELSMGDSTTIMAAAVKAAYLPTFTMASFREIFSPLAGMLVLFSNMQ